MDPNAGKKNLFNKLSKSQALDLVRKENFKRKTVSFYRYIFIEQPHELRDELYKKWNKLGVLGRIYLAEEGINAQLSVPVKEWKNFVSDVHATSYFEGIKFKEQTRYDLLK